MISKAICQQCLGNWTKFDEWDWGKGYVLCPVVVYFLTDSNRQRINEAPSSQCPYVLEHLMKEQNVK